MKRVSWTIIIIVVIVALLLPYYVRYHIRDLSKNQYTILRLNPESNMKGDEEDYVYWWGNQIILYSFVTGETKEYHLETTEAAGWSGFIIGTMLYSMMPDGTVRRFDLQKQTDEEILSKEDLCSMCGLTYLPDELDASIWRAGKNWLLMIDGYDGEEHYFICPIDGELKTDCVEVNTLFPKEDRTGREQTVLYRGMRIRRSYDTEKGEYRIIELGEKEKRPKIFDSAPIDTETIRVGGKLISVGHQRNNRFYWSEGDSEEHKIGCLQAPEFDFSVIQPHNIVAENGEIIGMVQLIKNFRCDSWDPPQNELKYEVLFRLDPKTGENSILYRTWNNRTRIIGYQDGVVYLMKNFKIYSRVMENEKEELIAKLPKDTYYEFDWQGDYLIVLDRDGIYGAYKVRQH